LKALIRKQRNEIYTIIYRPDGAMPDDNSLDPRYRDGICILGLCGPLGISLLCGADMEFLQAMELGETIEVELTANLIRTEVIENVLQDSSRYGCDR
jgi:hypothetical protein